MAEHPLVEKMARAICALDGDCPIASPYVDQNWTGCIPDARAALKVVTEWEPSEGMLEEGRSAVTAIQPGSATERSYRAMMSELKREAGLS